MICVVEGVDPPFPMSGPEYVGRPMPYRLLMWAYNTIVDALEALTGIRERTYPEFYPLDIGFGGNPERLVDEGLLIVAARRVADAAQLLARACCELDATSLTMLRAETKPPANLWKDGEYPTNAHLLTTAEEALGVITVPEQLLDECSGRALLTDLVAACRLAGTTLVASGHLRDADRDLVHRAIAPFE
jgi:hypothetical protein